MSHWFVHLFASSCVTWWCHHIVTPSTVSQYCSRRSRKSAAAFDLQTQLFVWAKWTGESFFGMTGLTKDQQCLHATLDNRSSTLLLKQSTPEALSLPGNQIDNTLGATCMVWSQNSFLASSLFEKSCFLSEHFPASCFLNLHSHLPLRGGWASQAQSHKDGADSKEQKRTT